MIENNVIIYNGDLEKTNCDFYMKMGACRHGKQCIKVHVKPLASRTVVLKHLYLNPKYFYDITTESFFHTKGITEKEVQQHFDNIFEDIFLECEDEYGRVTDMVICENLTDHLRGNIYIKFSNEKDAEKAVKNLNNRWFGGRPIYAELSPVNQFKKAYCRSLDNNECPKENLCNFWHVRLISENLYRKLRYRRNYYPWFLQRRNLEPQTSYEMEKRFKIINNSFVSRSQYSKNHDRSRSRSNSRSSRRDRSRTRSKSKSSRHGRSRTRSKSKSPRSYRRSHSSYSSRSRSRSKS